jgi:hypothetical protein
MDRRLPSWIPALALIGAFACAVPAAACSICGCGDPLESLAAARPSAGRTTLGLSWDEQDATAGLANDPGQTERIVRQTLRASVAYAPTGWLAFLVRVPFEQKSYSLTDPSQGHDAEIDGLGDADLGAQWILLQSVELAERSARWVSLGFGSSLNSGDNAVQDHGQRLDEHQQPGTGALGPFVSLRANGEDAELSHFAYAEAQWRATNASGYQYGSALRCGLGARYELGGLASPGLSLDARYTDFDHDWAAAAADPNTGGTLLSLTPSLGWRLGHDAGLKIQASVPVWKGLFGVQDAGTAWKASAQIQY